MIVCADEGDLDKMCILLMEMQHHDKLGMPPINPIKMQEAIRDCIQNGKVFVAKKEDDIVGILALKKGSHWFSDGTFLGDLVFFVSPRCRKSTLGSRLLRAASQYASISRLPLLMAVVSGEDVSRKDAFYSRHGFSRIGGVFARGL